MPRTPRPWFRLYSDILDNRKVKALKPALCWQWIELLALANLTKPRGCLPPLVDVAFRLRVTEGVALEAINRLIAAGLVEVTAQGYAMHDWSGDDGWQYESDARATDGRQNADDTRLLRRRSAAEPPQNHRKRGVTDTEAETDTETDQKQSQKQTPDVPVQPLPQNIFRETERAFGRQLSAYDCDSLREIETDYPEEVWRYALRECADLNKKTIRYMQAVCRNNAEGVPNGRDNPDYGGQRRGGDAGAAALAASNGLAIYGRGATEYVDPWAAGGGPAADDPPAPKSGLEDGRGRPTGEERAQEAADVRRAHSASGGARL